MIAIVVVGAVLVALALTVVVLRAKKLRQDSHHEDAPDERRLVTPPPSPYTPSRGFRLLDETGDPLVRPPVQRPRLDPERSYVFGDSMVHHEDALPTQLRHSDKWFLSRSSHRSTTSVVLRAVGVVLVIAIVIAVVTTYYMDHSKKSSSGDARRVTATTVTVSSTTTPVLYRPTSVSGEDANYSVGADRYRVTVVGASGETWTEYTMGPSKTLEWQGLVDEGKSESLVMTGDCEITLGSPSSATVAVDGRPVVFPNALPATLVLVFDATGAGSTNPA